MATILLLSVSALWGCSGENCTTLCTTVAVDLDGCRADWGLTWEAFGADSRADWQTRCQNDWDTVRADLEAREVPAADEQCYDAITELATMSDEERCDTLRALYVQ